jgi:chromosome segregation ATPase
LIVLCVLLGLVAVGFGLWALSERSDADDAEKRLAAALAAPAAAPEAAPEATPEATPEQPPSDTGDDDLAAQLEQMRSELGSLDESVEGIEQQIAAAKERFEQAQASRDDAEGAADSARAEIDALRSKADLAGACLRGTVDTLAAAFESGGTEAAVAQLQQLAGDCQAAVGTE